MNRPLGALFAVLAVATLAAGVAQGRQPTRRLPDMERGKQLYERHCIQCHGATAAGDGPATAALVAKVPDLRGKLPPKNLDRDAQLVQAGKGAMPGFFMSFDKYDARRTLRYMAQIGAPHQKPPEEKPKPQPPEEPDKDAGN